MISDFQIYRMEEIRDELIELMDETKAIVASSDDYIIGGRADVWLKNIRENTRSETNVVTISTTIDELWIDWYNYGYKGEE